MWYFYEKMRFGSLLWYAYIIQIESLLIEISQYKKHDENFAFLLSFLFYMPFHLCKLKIFSSYYYT